MGCLGPKPRVAGWKAQTNPLSYDGTQWQHLLPGGFESVLAVLQRVAARVPYHEEVFWRLEPIALIRRNVR